MSSDSTPSPTFVYLISSGAALKIGISSEPQARLKALQTSNPKTLSLLYVLECLDRESALAVESMLHSRYENSRLTNEWFDLDAQNVIADLEWSLRISSLIQQDSTTKIKEVIERKRISRSNTAAIRVNNHLEQYPDDANLTVRELAGKIGVSKSTVQRVFARSSV